MVGGLYPQGRSSWPLMRQARDLRNTISIAPLWNPGRTGAKGQTMTTDRQERLDAIATTQLHECQESWVRLV